MSEVRSRNVGTDMCRLLARDRRDEEGTDEREQEQQEGEEIAGAAQAEGTGSEQLSEAVIV
jgi:hypothetical protein